MRSYNGFITNGNTAALFNTETDVTGNTFVAPIVFTKVDGLLGIAYIYPLTGRITARDLDFANVVTDNTAPKVIASSILT